jgi:hypothetical protein
MMGEARRTVSDDIAASPSPESDVVEDNSAIMFTDVSKMLFIGDASSAAFPSRLDDGFTDIESCFSQSSSKNSRKTPRTTLSGDTPDKKRLDISASPSSHVLAGQVFSTVSMTPEKASKMIMSPESNVVDTESPISFADDNEDAPQPTSTCEYPRLNMSISPVSTECMTPTASSMTTSSVVDDLEHESKSTSTVNKELFADEDDAEDGPHTVSATVTVSDYEALECPVDDSLDYPVSFKVAVNNRKRPSLKKISDDEDVSEDTTVNKTLFLVDDMVSPVVVGPYDGYSRREIQKLAKQHGIIASGKTEDIISRLIDCDINVNEEDDGDEDRQALATSSEILSEVEDSEDEAIEVVSRSHVDDISSKRQVSRECKHHAMNRKQLAVKKSDIHGIDNADHTFASGEGITTKIARTLDILRLDCGWPGQFQPERHTLIFLFADRSRFNREGMTMISYDAPLTRNHRQTSAIHAGTSSLQVEVAFADNVRATALEFSFDGNILTCNDQGPETSHHVNCRISDTSSSRSWVAALKSHPSVSIGSIAETEVDFRRMPSDYFNQLMSSLLGPASMSTIHAEIIAEDSVFADELTITFCLTEDDHQKMRAMEPEWLRQNNKSGVYFQLRSATHTSGAIHMHLHACSYNSQVISLFSKYGVAKAMYAGEYVAQLHWKRTNNARFSKERPTDLTNIPSAAVGRGTDGGGTLALTNVSMIPFANYILSMKLTCILWIGYGNCEDLCFFLQYVNAKDKEFAGNLKIIGYEIEPDAASKGIELIQKSGFGDQFIGNIGDGGLAELVPNTIVYFTFVAGSIVTNLLVYNCLAHNISVVATFTRNAEKKLGSNLLYFAKPIKSAWKGHLKTSKECVTLQFYDITRITLASAHKQVVQDQLIGALKTLDLLTEIFLGRREKQDKGWKNSIHPMYRQNRIDLIQGVQHFIEEKELQPADVPALVELIYDGHLLDAMDVEVLESNETDICRFLWIQHRGLQNRRSFPAMITNSYRLQPMSRQVILGKLYNDMGSKMN